MATRRRAREVVLQMLFQFEATNDSPDTVIHLYKTNFGEGPLPDDFSCNLFTQITIDIPQIDKIIISASDNWRLERMSRVDRNILRMGVFELTKSPEMPTRIIINEAVELSKRFGSEESASFVNGVLDRIAKETRPSSDID
jgi:N utilization substance protein B